MAHLEVDRKIIMAVDFGTTFSGLAWAMTRKTLVIQWPDAVSGGLEGITSDKVPTEIRYDGQDFKWGFQISDSDLRNQWFKLGLDPSQYQGMSNLATAYPDSLALPLASNISPEKMVTDYLTALRKHAEQILRYKLPVGALVSTPLEFVITVPAVWTDGAQAKTRACAEKAGMGLGSALHVISEPEAAAMYALDAMDPHDIKVGDTFVLVDAGGGTVDLISYTVAALRPLLQIREAAPGTGSLCGSSFLNRIFQKTLKDKFKNDKFWDDDVLEEATKRFETVIKRAFRGVAGEEFQVPVPGLRDNPSKGVRRGKMRMTGNEVKDIFEPVVQEVIRLVLGQIEATKSDVKQVLLVGGFGSNSYLRERIRTAIGNVQIMQSPNGWTAVVRGALMKGLASTSPTFARVGVSGRSARKYYGTASSKPFDAVKHDGARKFYEDFSLTYRIMTMDWFVKKGHIVEENKPQTFSYVIRHELSTKRPTIIDIDISVCNDPNNEGAPTYPEENGINKLIALKADLNSISVDLFPQAKGVDQKIYYLVQFEVEVTFFSAYTKYELIHRGVNYGAVAAEYV